MKTHGLSHWLLHFLALLLGRHWLVGLANLGLTLLLGLGIVEVGQRLRLLGPGRRVALALTRTVLLVSLYKGALYMIMGESLDAAPSYHWFAGAQLPDPMAAFGWLPTLKSSIWHPTALSGRVSLLLLGLATLSLAWRALKLLLIWRRVDQWEQFMRGHADPRLAGLMLRAGEAFGLPPGSVPPIVSADKQRLGFSLQSPVLVGLRRPVILLPPRLARALTDEELEAVFRHELAHLVRRDHWWRWALLWVADIGGPTLLAGRVKGAVIGLEEQLCDRRAVRTPREALALANALQKAIAAAAQPDYDVADAAGGIAPGGPAGTAATRPGCRPWGRFPASATPLLLGDYAASWQGMTSLRGRLRALLTWSRELSCGTLAERATDGPWFLLRWACRLLLGLFLAAILYAKFYFAANIH